MNSDSREELFFVSFPSARQKLARLAYFCVCGRPSYAGDGFTLKKVGWLAGEMGASCSFGFETCENPDLSVSRPPSRGTKRRSERRVMFVWDESETNLLSLYFTSNFVNAL